VQGSGITLNASTGSISISANYNGTVTSVSVSGSNGIGTSITNATTTPSISLNLGAITPTSVSTGALTATGTTTLATSLTGVLKGTSGVVSTATANSDYLPATTGNSSQLLGSTGSGGLTNVSVGSGLTYSGGVLSASGGGTVTTVTTNNQSGIITLVSNPTTTPNISLSLGNITPLSDTSVFNGSIGATTPNTGVFTTLNINGYGYSTTPASTSNNTQVATTAFIVNALATQVTAINSQSAAYTLVLTDANKMIYHPSADTTARTFTIPANSSVAFPTGTIISFFNDTSAGTVTIAITSDTLVQANVGTTGSITLSAGHTASMIKVTSTRWVINVN